MRQVSPRFALEDMAAPSVDVSAIFAVARDQGLTDVQIRDHHFSNPVTHAISAAQVRSAATEAGVTITSMNALQRFDDWTPTRRAEANKLADYAAACGAKTVVLVPVNHGSRASTGERHDSLRFALNALKPILQSRGLVGLIEPLGFRTCSLRSKKEAADAIAAVDGQSVFRLMHDTFHHTLAGETSLFGELTGLVHISGVNDPTFWIYPDCFLGGSDNGSQIQALLDDGYAGPFSFELVEEVRTLDELAGALAASIDFVQRVLSTRKQLVAEVVNGMAPKASRVVTAEQPCEMPPASLSRASRCLPDRYCGVPATGRLR
ncbi:Xylose isomerase domain protein TIM barrel [Mesorhizobium metallidurans STM 2683]|uniref:Xylose isomerase domain protein TIM barrel n=5 Tax=Mesorhizobium TaxID=68287 RepID=A0A1R3V7P2_9HYPH|nr:MULTISPECIES: TIM barrel protein [Mesorhizobium]CAH2394245.1 Xylose isomerase domain protein TIM barrel [Mesorhizobium ventifaucium]CAH2399221.1 Xylose isomerase domain protein TIM barrel [Mesorhizobium escarrei]CCV09366.1 Xylose isomerase domain protein TIM barrel [Mesorhizobium metallidurans STM 2683]SIT55925.1 Xylose isomerase domain protein TIM barrel [Mesorhizobium prunaredense]SJM34715.1 Xylose isomerase domain protein TIM barrel [Mesorhizobium delmotii]